MVRIVVGVDGSASSREALRWALGEARLRGASLRVVYAWKMPIYVANGFAPVAIPDSTTLRQTAHRRLDESVEEVMCGATDIRVERKVVEGIAAEALVEEAAGADLLVVGSRGRGGFAGLLQGTVSQHCVSRAACPVVVVHTALASSGPTLLAPVAQARSAV